MATITIFDTADAEPTQNKTSRQLEYENMAKAALLPMHNYRIFYEHAMAAELSAVPNTTILSIVLKYISRYVQCVAMSTNDPPDRFHIVIQNEQPINVLLDGRSVMWPSRKQLKVCGIKILNDLIPIYNRGFLRQYDYVNQLQLLASGKYGLTDGTQKFTQQRPGFARIDFGDHTILFTEEPQAHHVIYKVVNFIKQSKDYFNANAQMPARYSVELANRHKSIDLPKSKTYPLGYSVKILELLNPLQYARFGNVFYFDVLFNLDRQELTPLYHVAEIIGIDSETFKTEYAQKRKKITEQTQYMREVAASHKKITDDTIKRIIALEKYNTPHISELDDKQIKVVNLEFTRRSVPQHESHAELKKAFAAMIDAQYKNFESLKKATAKVETLTEISKDSRNLLPSGDCPHFYYKCKLTLSDPANPQNIRSYLIANYGLPSDSTGYYCKICGGKLAELDNATQISFAEASSMAVVEDPLQMAIYKEATFIINLVVRFKDLMPVKPLIASITTGLRGPLSVEETKLYRSKTAAADSIADTLNLYICIYIYAALCALMVNNPGKIMFAREKPSESRGVKGGRHKTFNRHNNTLDEANSSIEKTYKFAQGGNVTTETDSKKAEALIIKQALILLLGSKEVVINKLKNMSVALIKAIFGVAYKWALNHIKPIAVTEAQAYVYKELDPVYDYAFLFKKASGVKLKYTDTEKILGRSLPAIETDRVRDILRYDTMPLADEITMDEKTPAKATAALALKYATDSYNYVAQYMRGHIYTQNVVPLHPQVAQFREKYEYIKDLEAVALIRAKILKLRPSLLLDFDIKNRHDYSYIDITQHYCSSGELHKVGAYVYASRAKKTGGARQTKTRYGAADEITYTKKEILGWLMENNKEKLAELSNLRVVNEKCEKCGQLIRDASGNLGGKSMTKLFNAQDNENAFYQYFDSRCPLGNLHEIVDGKCSKCGLNTAKPRNEEYYNKYFNVFVGNQKEKLKISIASLKRKPPQSIHSDVLEWTPTLKYTSELSQLSNVNYNIIINIGLTEGLKWPEIEQSKVNPSKALYSFKARSLKFKSHILNLVRMFNLIKNHRNVVELPKDLKEVFNKADIDAIYAKVKPADFIDLEDKYRYALTPENYCNFLQEFLAKFIIDICVGETGKKLMACIMNQIIIIERAFSKADPFYFKPDVVSAENATSSEGEKDANDVELPDDSGDEEPGDGFNNEGYDVEKADDVWEGD